MRASLWFCAGALFILLARPSVDRAREYVASVIVHEHESPDPVQRFFDLDVAQDGSSHLGLITDQQSKLADWLKEHDGKRIAISLTAGGALTRDGGDR